MAIIESLVTPSWSDYELIDSGDQQKLERFGKYVVVRPEPKALWHKFLPKARWSDVDGTYERNSQGGGRWRFAKRISNTWTLEWKSSRFLIKPTGFKHMGMFPEQAPIWEFIHDVIPASKRPIKVLNLFAYTGGSTLAAATAGASVTHVDSSKEVLSWARENLKLSKINDTSVRWIPEDAISFVRREVKRGNKYDAIIMDPPKFGRGGKNEIWKIEEDLPKLLSLCDQIMSQNPLFFIINAYAVSFSSLTLHNLLQQSMSRFDGDTHSGELILQTTSTGLYLPMSIYATWQSLH
jgi:23S rRNA (cytosine1962-C5)-methyltransferase